jgi:HD-GYP domain-containing protein (c-di-GMP phosphodiesterase class II)
MAQYTKQALPDIDAITTALSVVDGGLSTLIDTAYRRQSGPEILAALADKAGCSEIDRAIDLLNSLASAVAQIHRAVHRRQAPELQPARQAVDALIENFSGDPDALFWALAANRRMYHLCRRSVGCAVWALAMGRQLNFAPDALQDLLLGALLLDIGKLKLPVVILVKASSLNPAEQRFARRHVGEGIRILESIEGLSAESIEMVHAHHERIDGSGYPFRLRGDEISLYAQIAGIIDSFDALSLSRYYADGLSGNAAIRTLREQRGEKFDPLLIDQFFSAMGEFPTGTWVELPDGRTGVVCSQGLEIESADESGKQGRAQVALIADEQQQPYLAIHWLSLHEHSEVRALPPVERPRRAGAMERSLQAAIYAHRARKK